MLVPKAQKITITCRRLIHNFCVGKEVPQIESNEFKFKLILYVFIIFYQSSFLKNSIINIYIEVIENIV